ncbi:hypothetical protein EU528_07255 [Candidatus Thorarchaeota archaeon]|nr:MAG: hypothetical protein EU528_07255 [Candidatus Thorarchaeota archaeon]
MPHTGNIDETLDEEQELLMRARLHVKSGLDRFSHGMTVDAIAAFYDAISSAMQRCIIVREISTNEVDISEDFTLFKMLLKSGVFNDSITLEDFEYIRQTLEDAFENKLKTFDETSFLDVSESLLMQLGIIKEGEIVS